MIPDWWTLLCLQIGPAVFTTRHKPVPTLSTKTGSVCDYQPQESCEMIIFDTVILRIVAVLIRLKVILLAAAAVLFVSNLAARTGQRKAAPRRSSTGHPRLDLRA